MGNQESSYLSIEPTREGFEFWSQQSFVPDDLRQAITSASILFIPSIDFRENSGPTFPINTTFLLDYFKELAPEGLSVDIAVSDNEYRELALYNNYIRLGKFLIKDVALPIFINILSGFISDNITKKDDTIHPVQIVYNIQNNNFNQSTNQLNTSKNNASNEYPDNIGKSRNTSHRKHSQAHVPKYPTKHTGPSYVEFELTIEDSAGRKKSFRYEGPATEAHKITQEIKTLWNNEPRTDRE